MIWDPYLDDNTVKILKKPDTVKAILLGFPTIEDGGNCVTQIISEGIIPSRG